VRGPIVVGSDGSEISRLAIVEAGSIAGGTGQTVIVTFVRHIPLAGLCAVSAGSQGVHAMRETLDSSQALSEAQSIAILESTSVRWRFEVRTGEPVQELMRVAKECDADTIVVAGRRRGKFSGLARSSVSTRLLHRWPRSLLVIHPQSDAPIKDSAGEALSGQW
jgi:nucleotide-binding universal stress UspA family protein